MGDAARRKDYIRRVARERGYSQFPEYILVAGLWYSTKTGALRSGERERIENNAQRDLLLTRQQRERYHATEMNLRPHMQQLLLESQKRELAHFDATHVL